MNNPLMSSLILFSITCVALIASVTSLLLLRYARAETRDIHAVLLQMESEHAALSRDLDRHTERATLQGSRIAWLETRVRGTRAVTPVPEPPPTLDFSTKLTMTERRHRVLKLRQRGQDARTISATLGMQRGEVELILGLTVAACQS